MATLAPWTGEASGPAGPRGPQGNLGPPGPPGPAFFESIVAHGGTADESADSTVAIQAAIDALPAAGGTIIVDGKFRYSAPLNADGRRLRFIGLGGISAGGGCASRLNYTGTTHPAISGVSSVGLQFADVQLVYTGNMAGNYLIDARGTAADPTSFLLFERCYLGGEGTSSANTLVAIANANISIFDACVFANAGTAVRGRESNTQFSNVALFFGCTFKEMTVMPILDPGESWYFDDGCTFEPLASGAAGAIALQQTAPPFTGPGESPLKHLSVNGWMGDANAAGDWITVAGFDIKIGGRIGNGAHVFHITGPTQGLEVTASVEATTNLGTVVAGAHSGWRIEPTIIGAVGPIQFAAGSFPDRSRVNNPTDHYYLLGIVPVLAGAVNDAAFPDTPPNGTIAINGTGQFCWRSGGAWHTTP
jgi:hypothetical protein